MSDPHLIEDNDHVHPLARPFLFLMSEKVKRGFIIVPAVGLIISIIFGFIYPLHHPGPIDKMLPGFSWAVIGFVSYAFVVLASHPLFKLLGRKENYYGEDEMGIEREPDVPFIHVEVEEHHHD